MVLQTLFQQNPRKSCTHPPICGPGNWILNVGIFSAKPEPSRHLQHLESAFSLLAARRTALARVRMEGDRFAFLRGQLEEAEASVDLQSRRYASGVAGYADYLDALRNRLTVQTILAAAARDYALARLGVHRALGGTWIQELAGVDLPPLDADPIPSDAMSSNR